MSELSKLYRRSFGYLAGRVCVVLLGLISFPILTRIFSVSQYGTIALTLNTVALIVVISKMGLQHSLQRFYHETNASSGPNELQRFCSTLFFGAAGIAWMVTLIFTVGLWLAPDTLVSDQLRKLLLLASALIFIRSLESIFSNVLLIQGKTKGYNALQIGTKSGSVLIVILLLLTWNRTPEIFFVGTVLVEVAALFVALPFVLPLRVLTLRLFDPVIFRTVLLYGAPLMATEISWLVLDTGDRFLVHHYLGSVALGYYSAAYNLCDYFTRELTIPLNLALFPICMDVWVKKGKREIQALLSRLLDGYVLISIGLVCTFAVISHDAIELLASPKYQQAHRLLPVILAGLIVGAAQFFLRIGLLIEKRTFAMLQALVPACLLNVVMNIFLLPWLGIMGAAVATLASYACVTLLYARNSLRVLPLQVRWIGWARYLAAGALSGLIVARVVFNNMVLDLAVKGILSLILYGGILLCVDRRARQLVATSLQALLAKVGKSEEAAAAEFLIRDEELEPVNQNLVKSE